MTALGPFLLAASLAVPTALLRGLLCRGACALPRWRCNGLAPIPALLAALAALASGPFDLEAPALKLSLRLDLPAALLLAVSALLWIAVGAGAFVDAAERPEPRAAVSWLLTMIGSLGVFVADDLLSFYLFYALVSIPAYGMFALRSVAGDAAGRPRLHGLRHPGRGLSPLRLRHARRGRAARQSQNSRRRRRLAGFALARRGARAPRRRLRRQDGPRSAQRLDAALLRRDADPGRGRAQRRGRQGRRDRPHPLPAARNSARGLGRSARGHRLRDRLLRRRDRRHAGEPQGRARLFEREPDGSHRRRARHGARRGRSRTRLRSSPSMRPITCW